MKVAVIDLGTNTFHLLIAEIELGEAKVIYKTNVPVRLGEDITKENSIITIAFNRGVACLKEFRKAVDLYNVEVIKAVATSAVRSSKNGNDFVVAAKQIAGINIDIIDGDEEANYIYEGVKWSGAITQSSLIMDIGGGSTEFILCDQENLIWKKSYDIGAARLMQSFFKSDPISMNDQLVVSDHLDRQLTELITLCKLHKPKTLIGSAGAFDTFDIMINPRLANYTSNIDYHAYQELSSKLIGANHQQRANMEGLIPLRVDMIVMAALLTNYVLDKLDINKITLSTYDLKMGVLSSLIR